MSLCIICYGIHMLGMALTLRAVIAYGFWVLVMTVLYYEMEVILRSASLYVDSMARLEQLEDSCIELCMKLPGIAFYGGYKVIFYLILPYGIMATLPVQRLVGDMNLRTAVYGIGVVGVFTAITAVLWKQGLKHYNSASS